ncbi:hypothetical protein CSA37_11105 [Candidatus Fermentibacteria bacterium]|nr:MAG: hypothetical protein CSA37_11105 [Candidatus Fermentibacteria bacterium]
MYIHRHRSGVLISGERRKKLVPDIDAIDNTIHGNQEGKYFHKYCGTYCYTPCIHFETAIRSEQSWTFPVQTREELLRWSSLSAN